MLQRHSRHQRARGRRGLVVGLPSGKRCCWKWNQRVTTTLRRELRGIRRALGTNLKRAKRRARSTRLQSGNLFPAPEGVETPLGAPDPYRSTNATQQSSNAVNQQQGHPQRYNLPSSTTSFLFATKQQLQSLPGRLAGIRLSASSTAAQYHVPAAGACGGPRTRGIRPRCSRFPLRRRPSGNCRLCQRHSPSRLRTRASSQPAASAVECSCEHPSSMT